MKTEKRPAREGERILIVDAFFPIGYENGDVLTVIYCSSWSSSVVAESKRHGTALVYGKEYEVVVENEEKDADKPAVDGEGEALAVGDFVFALPHSDARYGMTTYSNAYVGKVVKLLNNKTVVLETISAKKRPLGNVHTVDPTYFKKVDAPDATDATESASDDVVAHPSHYTSGKFEVIEVIEEFTQGYEPYEAYCVGNVIKYVARAPHKHATPLQDLKKARQYLDFAIERIEAEGE